MRLERGLQRFTQIVQLFEAEAAVTRHHIRHQLLTAVAIHRQHHAFAHAVLSEQTRFDFTQFDAETAHLDLMIDAADVFDPAVIAEASQVAGAVHAFAAAREWIGHETFGGKARAEQVATGDAVAGQVQFGRHAQRRLLQLTVEHIRRGVDQRPADVRLTTQFAAGAGRIGSVFRRPVQVVDVRHRRFAVERVDQALLQWLAGEVDNAHARRNLPGAL